MARRADHDRQDRGVHALLAAARGSSSQRAQRPGRPRPAARTPGLKKIRLRTTYAPSTDPEPDRRRQVAPGPAVIRPGRSAEADDVPSWLDLGSRCLPSVLAALGDLGSRPDGLDLEELGFLVLEDVVDLRRRSFLVAWSSCFSARATSSSPTSLSLTILSSASLAQRRCVADRDPGVLGLVPGQLDVLLAPLLGQLRQRDPDDVAVVGRVDAEIGVADRLLDRGHRGLVVRGDQDHPGVRHLEGGELLQRGRRSRSSRRSAWRTSPGGPDPCGSPRSPPWRTRRPSPS